MTREEMLGRVRRALGGAPAPDLAAAPAQLPLAGASGGPLRAGRAAPPGHATSALLDRFTAEARAVGAVVHLAADVAAAAEILARLARGAAPSCRVVGWRTPLVSDVVTVARNATAELDVRFADDPEAAIADVDVGITEVDALVAESGTLVLGAAGGRHRSTSLLPRMHVALARTDQLVADLAAAFRRASEGACGGACTTLITGPSRTADIEKKLVIGVHGPCELHVIVLGGRAVGDPS